MRVKQELLAFLNCQKHLPRLEKKFIETYVMRNLVDSPNKIIHLKRKFKKKS